MKIYLFLDFRDVSYHTTMIIGLDSLFLHHLLTSDW